MRLLTSAALIGLPATALALSASGSSSQRKTLAWGTGARSKFSTSPIANSYFTTADLGKKSPVDIAFAFARSLTAHDVRVRDDAYTDDHTGVTHVYIRQLVKGMEVWDGDFNVNVDKDGNVISWGSSFYDGPEPIDLLDEGVHERCSDLRESLARHITPSHNSEAQMVFGATSSERLAALQHSVLLYCPHRQTDAFLLSSLPAHQQPLLQHARSLNLPPTADLHPASVAALSLVALTTTDESLSQALYDDLPSHLDGVTSSFETHLHSDGTETVVETLHGVPDTIGPVKASVGWSQRQLEDGKTELVPVWKLEMPMKLNSYEATMPAANPKLPLSIVDWVADSPVPKPSPPAAVDPLYKVYKWGVNDPSVGHRLSLHSPHDHHASPLGWHSIPAGTRLPFSDVQAKGGSTNFTDTRGNNVFAHENWQGADNWISNYRPNAGPSLNFSYHLGIKHIDGQELSPRTYINASITELFFTCNLIHDLYARYGFDEKAGNFQENNFGRGGKGGDAVVANAQDGSGYNNANFMTPPDGQRPRMRMYVWDTAKPWRDGDLEAGIVIHEYTHGLSTRLTGGPANSGCLGWGEAGGMGEGWGDALATIIRSKKKYHDYAMGSWAANRANGIRHYPYSSNSTINPSVYKTLDGPGYFGVHAIGEVWAEMLFELVIVLEAKHGFSTTLFPPAPQADGTYAADGEGFYRPIDPSDAEAKSKPRVPIHGNTLATQLIIDGMKLQPCRPSFIDARNAIIQADEILTGGENACEIWTAFAKRGLGPDAALRGGTPWGGGIRENDFSVPKSACGGKDVPPKKKKGDSKPFF